MTNTPTSLLLARFHLQAEALAGLQVATFDFAWQGALDAFLDELQQERHQKLQDDEYPPFRRLNSVLFALAPQLVHGFDIIAHTPEGKPVRQLLALPTTERPWLPTPAQIQGVVRMWATDWLNQRFAPFLAGAGRTLRSLERLQDAIQQLPGQWQFHDAADLWRDPTDHLRYRAIPSLLIAQARGQTSHIDDRAIVWHLSQGANQRLMVVSEPQSSSFTDRYQQTKLGTFAYTLTFALQTHAGSHESWLHLFASCRRYPDVELTKVNHGRDVTVMVRTNHPRLQQWQAEPTAIRLRIQATPHLEQVEWADRVPDLLAQIQARPLADPQAILAEPVAFRSPGQQPFGDTYFPLYAEGFRAQHPVKTGFGEREYGQIVLAVSRLYQDVLIPDGALQRDAATTKARRSLALADSAKVHQRLKADGPAYIGQRLRVAARGKPICVVLCWNTDVTLEAMRQEVRRVLLGKPTGSDWPPGVTVVEHHVSDALCGPLDVGALNPLDVYNKQRPQDFWKNWHRQMSHARLQRQREWQTQVWSSIQTAPDTLRLALIEVPNFERRRIPNAKSTYHETQWPTQAIRASVVLDWQGTAQFLRPMRMTTDEDTGITTLGKESQGRLANAVGETLVRQPGVLHGRLVDLYEHEAALPAVVAQRLIVTGLYRLRMYKTASAPAVDFALAIRLLPDGEISGRFPGSEWMSYHALQRQIGVLAARNKSLAQKPEDVQLFIGEMLSNEVQQPHLVMLVANQWRNDRWPQIRNDALQPNALALPYQDHLHRPLVPADRPHLRVARLRRRGPSGETPQYVATMDAPTWQEIEEVKAVRSAAGFEDTRIRSPFLHYLSIADRPETSKNQDEDAMKHSDGGDVAFKHPTVLEIVPVFLQPEDTDRLPWARVPHVLRQSPAWGNGGLALPYPLHLADRAMKDHLALSSSGSDDD